MILTTQLKIYHVFGTWDPKGKDTKNFETPHLDILRIDCIDSDYTSIQRGVRISQSVFAWFQNRGV